MKKILVIQTAFIGDVILATPVLEKLTLTFGDAKIDVLVRAGNESLFRSHPFLNEVLIWNKNRRKFAHLLKLIFAIRKKKYDAVINLQRFASTGLIAALSNATYKAGFDKNPFSFCYHHKARHILGNKGDTHFVHEAERNLLVLKGLTDEADSTMRLYPSNEDQQWADQFSKESFITISPASVWYTKQLPADRWISFINALRGFKIMLLGGKGDRKYCEFIASHCISEVSIMCGELSFLRSAALMQRASMNYVNDSAPMHLASAVNAPVTAVYCSTIPEFGFGPRSSNARIIEVQGTLDCRPCGNHGKRVCPLGHFNCAKISTEQLIQAMP